MSSQEKTKSSREKFAVIRGNEKLEKLPKYLALEEAVRDYFRSNPENRMLIQNGRIELDGIKSGKVKFNEIFDYVQGLKYGEVVIFVEEEDQKRYKIEFYKTLADAVEKRPALLNEGQRTYSRQVNLGLRVVPQSKR